MKKREGEEKRGGVEKRSTNLSPKSTRYYTRQGRREWSQGVFQSSIKSLYILAFPQPFFAESTDL